MILLALSFQAACTPGNPPYTSPPTCDHGFATGRHFAFVRFEPIANALQSVTASISLAGGRAEFTLSVDDDLSASAYVDGIAFDVLCRHDMVAQVEILLPPRPN